MVRSDEEWLLVADAFYSAALNGDWYGALEKLAAATGSRAGELIGLGSANTVPFNWVTDLDHEWLDDFIAVGGGDPEVNPFVRAGISIPELTVLQSADFVTPEERRTSPFLTMHATHFDITHICLSPLIKNEDGLVGLAVMRSASQGEINPREREVFTTLAPHVRASVRMQMALEHQGAQIMAGALEAMAQAVFICDRLGQVQAMTSVAESILSAGAPLRLQQGMLCTSYRDETQTLQDAIARVARGLVKPGSPLVRTVVLRGAANDNTVLEVLPLPRSEYTFGFEPRALVVVRNAARCDTEQVSALLQVTYGLTPIEAEVALLLTDGHSPEAISQLRDTSISTVRTQIRSVYAKIGVHRQVELASVINQLR